MATMGMRRSGSAHGALAGCGLFALTLCASGCRGSKVEVPVSAGESARRAAASFAHCVEGGSSGCIRGNAGMGAWDAFAMLGWLASGSPTAILDAFARELQNHGEPNQVQARLVETVETYQMSIRGAECDPAVEQKIGPLVDRVAKVVQQRMTALGLWRPDLIEVVRGLGDEARSGLADGYIVTMRCKSDPFVLYLATSADGLRQVVVGMAMSLPGFLGGDATATTVVDARLGSRALGLRTATAAVSEGTVHAWLPFALEVF